MIGKTIAHYEITSQLGKGGMGEVYQATDKKLGRDVAIKVLPEEFVRDPDRVARFQREAKLLASLNHPNIAAIYGLEESGGNSFLVLELIEGKTLSDRIKAGPVALEEALKLAIQITEALEAAHENGVIHRDLKPSNIKITPEGRVKVLDFGLAKAFAGETATAELSNSPTLSDAATRQGVILGTAAYMSPEQATGKSVDKRADIWAFGVVLFEMLTGKKLFEGETVTETLAGVIKSEPEWNSLPPELHPRIRFLLERCLKKVPKNRYSGISDARVDIQEVLSNPEESYGRQFSGMEHRTRQRSITVWAALTVILIAVAGAIIWHLKPAPPPEPKRVMRFTYELPEGQEFNRDDDGSFMVPLAVSPDGDRFVYGTTEGLYLRSVDALDARLITGTDRYSDWPRFSPDGQWICYLSGNDRKLKKIAVTGGAPVVLCDVGLIFAGMSWGPDNTIVYSDIINGGVKRISSNGGTPESLIEEDLTNYVSVEKKGVSVFPSLLPDGKTLLFTHAFGLNSADMQIVAQSLASEERKVLVEGGRDGKYLPTGHLLYRLDNGNAYDLIAMPFNPEKIEVTGGPVPLFEAFLADDVSESGTLIYVSWPADAAGSGSQTSSEPNPSSARRLVWVDIEGREEPIQAPPYIYRNPRISPDGTKAALYFTTGGNQDIWVWDFLRETMTRLTFDRGEDFTPLWTPDGLKIAFCSVREEAILKGGFGGVFMKAADGTGEVEFIGAAKERVIFPYTWSADGNTLITAELNLVDASTANELTMPLDISMFSMDGDHERKLLIGGKYMETHPRISPDGKWMAYSSDESGRNEIYVRPFPDVNKGKWQVSTGGGLCALWSPDGRELFYLIGDTEVEAVMGVTVETEPVFKPGKPRLLFHGKYIGPSPDNGVPWDIHPDGKRFLLIKPPEVTTEGTQVETPVPVGPRRINIVLNWLEELKQRVPVSK